MDNPLKRGWLVLLPLILVLGARALPARHQPAAVAAVLLAALLAWGWTLAQRPPLPRAIALLARSPEVGRIGAWELCLLALVAVTARAYWAVGWRMVNLAYADGAYYYGVARHMALTGRFEEPMVWHFLQPPDAIVHAPFDYWGPMTTLLLVPVLAVFGATPNTAILAMAVVSAASVLVFWYLICVALPLRYYATQLLALVLFAFSPAMKLYRFQPESVSVAQLFILLALVAFCHRWSVVALLCGFCILLTRGDGAILFSLIFLAVLLQEARGAGGSSRQLWQIVLAGLACVGVYVLWSFVSFGTLTPPATQIVPFLDSYWQVYHFGEPHQRSASEILQRFAYPYLMGRVRLGLDALRAVPFVPVLDWWLVMAVAAAPLLLRHRARAAVLIWALCFGGYALVVWVGGPGFAPVRAPYVFTPLVVLAGALGVDAILSQLDAWMQRGTSVRTRAVLVGAAVFAFCWFLLDRIPVRAAIPYRTGAAVSIQKDLHRLDQVLHGEPVASNRPWEIVAYTQSPSVSIPTNGDAAVEAVLARYGVRWLAIFGSPPPDRARGSAFMELFATGATDLGQFRLERVPVEGKLPAVYRVSPAAAPVIPARGAAR